MRIPLTRSAHCGCNAWTGPCPPSRRCRRSAGWRSWRRRWSRAASCMRALRRAGQPDQRQGRDDTLWRHGRRIELPVQRRDRRAWLGGGKNGIGNMEHGVVLTGRSFSVDPGAVIDVSGGGTLAGAAFVSGRGGSTDPCTTRCPVRPAIGPIRTADAGRPPGLCHPARVARPVCAAGAEGCLRRLRGIPAIARRNHHHRRGRARSGGGHLYAAPRVLRAPARRFPRRGWGECAAVRACRPARRILDGDGDARAGRHGHRRRLAPSGADHAGRRVAPARAIQRWTTRPTSWRTHAQGCRVRGRLRMSLRSNCDSSRTRTAQARRRSDSKARCAPTEARRAMAAR